MWQTIVFILIGFFCGSIMFGSIISKVFFNVKIKEHGSKNSGATNAGRILGKAAGFFTFFFDALKGSLAIGIAFLLKQHVEIFTDINVFVAGMGAVLGHCYSPFLKGKGGKGVATSIGVVCMISPFFIPVTAVVWIGTVLLTSYVSAASIMYAAVVLVMGVSIPSILQENLLYANHGFEITDLDYKILICVIVAVTILIIIRHHENMARLYNGTERTANWKRFVKRIANKKKSK